MTLLFGLIFFSITFLHIYVFQKVYLSADDGEKYAPALVRGMIAGAVTNYFVFLTFSYCFGGYSFLMIFYGLPFSISIGVVLTLIYFWISDKLDLDMNFISRAFSGGLIAVFIGLAIMNCLSNKNSSADSDRLFSTIFYWFVMGLTSGIMARSEN